MKKYIPIIILFIGLIVIIAVLGNYCYNRTLDQEGEYGETLEPAPEPTALSLSETALKEKVVDLKAETITANEWKDDAAGLLDKMIEQSGISQGQFISEYRGQDYNFVIRDLERIKAEAE